MGSLWSSRGNKWGGCARSRSLGSETFIWKFVLYVLWSGWRLSKKFILVSNNIFVGVSRSCVMFGRSDCGLLFLQRNPKSPDFKHKFTRKALWVDGWSTPSWVKATLSEGKLQSHVGHSQETPLWNRYWHDHSTPAFPWIQGVDATYLFALDEAHELNVDTKHTSPNLLNGVQLRVCNWSMF